MFLCFSFIISTFTLNAQIFQADRLKIDSLKKILIAANDTAKVNCLNAFGAIYQENQTDSALFYSNRALDDAKKINYKRGAAEALLVIGNVYLTRGNYKLAGETFDLCITDYKKELDVRGQAWAYFGAGSAFSMQSNFQSATQAYELANDLFKKAKDIQGSSLTLFFLAFNYELSGFYEKAFELCTRNLKETEKNNQQVFSFSLMNMGCLFRNIEDYQAALDYYIQADVYTKKYQLLWTAQPFIGEIYCLMGKFDSSQYYLNGGLTFFEVMQKDSAAKKEAIMSINMSLGELYLAQKDYSKALGSFSEPMKFYIWGNSRNLLMRILLDIAKTYTGKKEYNTALEYAKKLLHLAKETGAKQFIRDGTGLVWNIYDQLQQTDSAYFYYRQYTLMKDSLLNARYVRQLSLFKQKLKTEKEQLEMHLIFQNKSLKKNIVIGMLLGVAIFAFIVIRSVSLKRKTEKLRLTDQLRFQKLKSEKINAELQQHTIELEMQALRAQMNPHFIFNSLNSINRFILQNNKTQASEYLTKFSRLVRLILQNSQAALIPLESELESLQLYLELEAVRFDHHFEFTIKVADSLETDVIKVPPLIIQPYAENAIWHGLMHKEEEGFLEIELFQQDDFLYCKITDDGVGRKKATEIKSKTASTHKSMGMQITASRIEMLQQKNLLDASIKITDLVLPDGSPGGTEVLLKIPVSYD
jgi:tetratricopeptide (TPR) repeat protein